MIQTFIKRKMMKRLNVVRWILLILSPFIGIGACFIKVRPSPDHVGWGVPFPIVIWERTDNCWIDFPGTAAFVLNPLFYFLLGFGLFWVFGKINRKNAEQSNAGDPPKADT